MHGDVSPRCSVPVDIHHADPDHTSEPDDEVRGTRSIGKASMRLNDAMPRIEVDPQTYEVRADGVLPDDPTLHACIVTYASERMAAVGRVMRTSPVARWRRWMLPSPSPP